MTIKQLKLIIEDIKDNDIEHRNKNSNFEYIEMIYNIMMYRNHLGSPIDIEIYSSLVNKFEFDDLSAYKIVIMNSYEYFLVLSFRCLITLYGKDLEYMLSGLSYKKDISIVMNKNEIMEVIIRSVTLRRYDKAFSGFIRLFELEDISCSKVKTVLQLIYLHET
jgi:hypothetical protein